MEVSTLRPGLLVSLKTSIKGNVQYLKETIEAPTITASGMERERWETLRLVSDPAELELAKKARSKVISLVRSVCATSGFGLLCPQADEADLDKIIAEARNVAAKFNAGALSTTVSVYVMVGRIADNDLEAVKAINSEVRDLLTAMAEGVKKLDPVAIRDAADRARSLGAMLSPQAKANVQTAIDAARRAARDIVKAGEQASIEVDNQVLARIADMRMAFLDLDETETPIVMPEAEAGHAVDLDPTLGAALDMADAIAGPQAVDIDPNWEL